MAGDLLIFVVEAERIVHDLHVLCLASNIGRTVGGQLNASCTWPLKQDPKKGYKDFLNFYTLYFVLRVETSTITYDNLNLEGDQCPTGLLINQAGFLRQEGRNTELKLVYYLIDPLLLYAIALLLIKYFENVRISQYHCDSNE